MATYINPPASFSAVRSAFNAEGYGISNSFLAYRQGNGGTIVPATTPFDAIGAGTSGDPLRLGQFSGFTVPSLYTPPTVSLGNHTLAGSADDTGPLTVTTTFILNSSGMSLVNLSTTSFSGLMTIDGSPNIVTNQNSDFNIETWLDSGNNSDVAVYVTKGAGSTLTPASSALNTYLNLGTTRQWGVQTTRSSLGFSSAATTLNITLVEASNTSNVLDTATISISAEASYTT